MPRQPSRRLTSPDDNPSEVSSKDLRNRKQRRGRERREDRGSSDGHTYPQINIGGRASVHLGDQYHRQAERETASTAQQPATVSDLLDLVSVILNVVSIAGPWLNIYPEVFPRLPCVNVDHSLITTALATFRDFGASLRAKHVSTSETAGSSTGRGLVTTIEAAEELIHSATSKAVGFSDAIVSELDDLLIQGIGKTFINFRNALENGAAPEQLDKYHVTLSTLCDDLALSLLLLLCSENSLSEIQAKAREGTAPDFASALLPFAKNHKEEVNEITYIFATERRFSSSGRLREAQDWLTEHTTIVPRFLQALEYCSATSRTTRIRRTIIRSLAFPEMNARYHEISEAEMTTFEWIYKSESNGDAPSSPFAAWLQDQDPEQHELFWVSGKPGSGKSTLMRFLADDRRTQRLAREWAHDSHLVIVKSFFWSPGTWLQKSQQGLLRSILFQLLSAYPSFPPEVIPHSWTHLQLHSQHQIIWKTAELEYAIFEHVKHLEARTKILLIVDGLDEYHSHDKARDHEERQATCTLLRSIGKQETVKVCASSRPWNVYRSEFKACPSLRLEDLTRGDIRKFVDRKFQASAYFKTWALANPTDSTSFVEGIVDRAQGVFLWVRLVVKSLLQGLQNQDDSDDLTRRLEQLPTDLEEYFRRIVCSLEKFYLEQASHIFVTALSGPPQLLLLYHFMYSSTLTGIPNSSPRTYDIKRVLHVQASEEYRINARCMGLLEPIPARHVNRRHRAGVQMVDFLHRTARDFMASDEMQTRLRAWQRKEFDCIYERIKGIASLLRSCEDRSPWLPENVRDDLVADAMALTKKVNWEDRRVWRMLGQIEDEVSRLSRDDEAHDTFLIEALRKHHPYARYAIRQWDRLPPHNGQPWLDIAINGVEDDEKMVRLVQDTRNDTCFAIVGDLLALGANPNEVILVPHGLVSARQTVWTRHLEHQLSGKGLDRDFKPSFSMMKLLIQNGATSLVRMGGEDFHKGPEPHAAMQKLFSVRKADYLCEMLDASAEKQPRRKAMKFIVDMLRK